MQERNPIARVRHALIHAAEAQRGRMFLWAPVFMGSGILSYDALKQEPVPQMALICFGIAVVCLLAGLRWAFLRPALIPLACALIGFSAAQFETSSKPALLDLPRKSVLIQGDVRGVDLLPDGGRRLTLARVQIANSAPLPRLLRLTMQPDDPVTPDAGDHIRTRALLENPSAPSWPGARDPQFDAFFADESGSGRALALVEDLGGGSPSRLAQLRQTIAAKVVATLPGTQGAIAATLMAGATAAIPETDRAAFANSGLAHILAVAGLHMATVMGLVFAAVRLGLVLVPRWGLILPCKQIAAVAGLLAGFAYLLLTGDHVPTERSFAMAALVVLAVLSGRRVISLRGLALAAMAVLLIAPHTLVGVSFQMSFSAVLALIAGYRAMEPWLARMQDLQGPLGWAARHFAALCLTSFLAGTATLPFAAAGFGQIQIYYVVANLAAVPITVLVVMPMAVAALILMPFGASFPPLWLMGKGITAILWIARLVSSLPEAVVPWPPTPAWGLIAVGLGIVALGLLHGRVRLLGLLPLALGLAAPFIITRPDFLVARDGRLVAWRNGAMVQSWQAKGGAKIELADWVKVWPRATWQPIGDCADGLCRLQSGQVTIVTRAESVDCTAQLILAMVPLRDACPDATKIDRLDLWRNGAYAGWWHQGKPLMISDRDFRGARPWVPSADQSAITAQPLAESE